MSTKSGTGIIIGRFQTFRLNAEHERLIDSVLQRHARVIVFLSANPAPSDRHPLDWKWRDQLFREKYANQVESLEMPDLPDDRIWSQELDRRILELRPGDRVTLYGTRDGLVKPYSGRYRTKLLETKRAGDTFDLPREDGELDAASFRAGVIYGMLTRFPTVYPTVDIAVLRHEEQEVLLARKENETGWRFPGGFADPEDMNFEMSAIRELTEECGEILVERLCYLGSWHMDDWRYRDSMDCVITHFYACLYAEGQPVAGDDVAELRWFELAKIRSELLAPEHRPLLKLLQHFVEGNVE